MPHLGLSGVRFGRPGGTFAQRGAVCSGRRNGVLSDAMHPDYDSWRDEIERGDGYAVGGAGTFRPVRVRQRWRAAIIDRLRLVIIDLVLLALCALAAFLTALTRWVAFLAVAAVMVTFTGLWFRQQRLERERRPR